MIEKRNYYELDKDIFVFLPITNLFAFLKPFSLLIIEPSPIIEFSIGTFTPDIKQSSNIIEFSIIDLSIFTPFPIDVYGPI